MPAAAAARAAATPATSSVAARRPAAPGNSSAAAARAAAAVRPADASKSAATTSATTIDALFAPLPTVETRGRAWLYVNKQLKPVDLRLGITDGTFTEVMNDSELPATRTS